jgi:hypothetical protein
LVQFPAQVPQDSPHTGSGPHARPLQSGLQGAGTQTPRSQTSSLEQGTRVSVVPRVSQTRTARLSVAQWTASGTQVRAWQDAPPLAIVHTLFCASQSLTV